MWHLQWDYPWARRYTDFILNGVITDFIDYLLLASYLRLHYQHYDAPLHSALITR